MGSFYLTASNASHAKLCAGSQSHFFLSIKMFSCGKAGQRRIIEASVRPAFMIGEGKVSLSMLPLLRSQLSSLIAIAIAIACGNRSADAGVLMECSWRDCVAISPAHAPADTTEAEALSDGAHSGVRDVRLLNNGGTSPLAVSCALVELADVATTGLTQIEDSSLPDEPFLDGLAKPA